MTAHGFARVTVRQEMHAISQPRQGLGGKQAQSLRAARLDVQEQIIPVIDAQSFLIHA